MERERFEAIASGRSSIQSVPRSEGKSGLRAGGQARQLGGRCYSGKLLPKNQTGYRREADRCHLRAEQSWKRGRTNEALSFFVFSAERQGRVKNPWKKERLSRSRSKRKTVALNLAFPASFSRPSYRSAGFSCSPSVSREKGSCAALFSAARRELARRKSAEGRKKIYMEAATGSLCTPPPSSCFLFSFLLERERERKVARAGVAR